MIKNGPIRLPISTGTRTVYSDVVLIRTLGLQIIPALHVTKAEDIHNRCSSAGSLPSWELFSGKRPEVNPGFWPRPRPAGSGWPGSPTRADWRADRGWTGTGGAG